jgi:hypothetical protein
MEVAKSLIGKDDQSSLIDEIPVIDLLDQDPILSFGFGKLAGPLFHFPLQVSSVLPDLLPRSGVG